MELRESIHHFRATLNYSYVYMGVEEIYIVQQKLENEMKH